jgi:small subunit ribosomal protein S6
MRRYETIVIIDPDLSEDDRTSLIERIKEIIPQQEGVFLQEDLWGIKKLAYDIKKKPRGFYARFDYCGFGPVVDELERLCKIDDRVMKYLTVQLAPEVDLEKIQEEIAAAQASAAGPEPAPQADVRVDDKPVDSDESSDSPVDEQSDAAPGEPVEEAPEQTPDESPDDAAAEKPDDTSETESQKE